MLMIMSLNAALGYGGDTVAMHRCMGQKGTVSSTVYGFRIDNSESSPSSKVTYLEDAVGMTPAYMDYTNDVFNYGSWSDAFFMPRPCMLKYDGTVDYYLDPDDYTKKADGVTASDVANTSYGGNAMMEWGRDGKKIWYKIVPDSNNPKSASVYIADKQIDNDYHAWSFINNQGNLVDHFYTPIYNIRVDSGKARSMSGWSASNSNTSANERTYAKANNPSTDVMWDLEVYADRLLITLLCILISKTTDASTAFGKGLASGGNQSVNNGFNTGIHNTKGLFYGTNSGLVSSGNYGNAVKIFGMENYYGFAWKRILGWVNTTSGQKVKLTHGTQDGSTASDYDFTGNGYISVSNSTPTGTSGNHLKEMLFDSTGIMLPQNASGASSSTYYCDEFLFDNTKTTLAGVGEHDARNADVVDNIGLFAVYLYFDGTFTAWNCTGSLSCKPLSS